MKSLICMLSVVLLTPVLAGSPSPYAGQEKQALKALSDEEVASLLKGEGMGMAKAAELNGYPGPRHVLDLADELHLSAAQRSAVKAIYDEMSAAAKPLGARLVDDERELDRRFASGQVTAKQIADATARIAALQGQLRSIHLSAHVQTRSLLQAEQLSLYQQLRGYGGDATPEHHHHG